MDQFNRKLAMMYRIVGSDGRQYGPVSDEVVRRWIAEGRAAAQTQAQQEGASEWKALISFPEFAAGLGPALPPLMAVAANRAVAQKASNKLAAGICGILLGGFGVHKFILGYTNAGLIMLLVSILSCGLAWWVMHIIGLIEGIVYLAKSDEEFVRIYVDGRKDWF